MCIIGFMRDFSLPILALFYVKQWSSVCVALNLAASWRISRMNVWIDRFQNAQWSEEKLCLITKSTFPRNKITSIPVKFGSEILNVYLILALLYLLASEWLGRSVAMGWTVRGSNPGVNEIFRISPHWSWGPTQPPVQWVPILCLRGKAAGAWR